MRQFVRLFVASACCCHLVVGVIAGYPRQNPTVAKRDISNPNAAKPYGEGKRSIDPSVVEMLRIAISKAEEPAIRVFLGLRCARFLWEQKLKEEGNRFVEEAFADLTSNRNKIPEANFTYLRSQLLGSLRSNAPELLNPLSDRFLGQNDSESRTEQTQRNGFDSVVTTGNLESNLKAFRQALANGCDARELIWFLDRAGKENERNLPAFLEEVLATSQPLRGLSSVNLLAFLQHLYLRDENPIELRTHFILAVMNVTERSRTWSNQDDLRFAYGLLGNVLPLIQTLTPDLYPEARARMGSVATLLPQSLLSRMAAENRIREGADKPVQILADINSKDNESNRQDLLRTGARLALEKGQFESALDFAGELKSEGNADGLWRDQFLEELVSQTLDRGKLEIAKGACEKIGKPITRASALRRVALFLAASNDLVSARSMLNSAAKVTTSLDDSSAKVTSLFAMAKAAEKIDDLRVPEFIGAAVKVINHLSDIADNKTHAEEKEKDRKARIATLIAVATQVIPGFQSLARKDYIGAHGLAQEIQPVEIRACAMVAAYMEAAASSAVGDSTSK